MIYLTVGTQLPFDRLVELVDRFCATRPELEVFGQIGNGRYRPRHFDHTPLVSPSESRAHFQRADMVIAHVGIGSIFTALELGKPILMMPRLARHGEHRDDHQEQTLRHFSRISLCYPFSTAEELGWAMQVAGAGEAREALPPYAPDSTLDALRRILA